MFRAILKVVVGTLLLACLLTPLVYLGIQHLLSGAGWPFSRIFDRVATAAALGLLWRYRAQFALREIFAEFGLRSLRSGGISRLICGLVLSLAVSAVAMPFIISHHTALTWAGQGGAYYLHKLFKVLPIALVVSLIEEVIFRVILFGRLARVYGRGRLPIVCVAIGSSIVYSAVHFFSPARSFSVSNITPWTGFEYLTVVFERLLSYDVFAAAFGLFFVGVVLCFVYRISASFSLCVGLHMGWVIAMKMAFYSTAVTNPQYFQTGLGRRYFLLAEPLCWASVGVVLLIVALVFHRRVRLMIGGAPVAEVIPVPDRYRASSEGSSQRRAASEGDVCRRAS